jgi:DNA-binding response OmpR family regulator
MPSEKKILVADDDPNVLFLITALLSKSRYQVVQAVDGTQALELARSLHPHLMVLDVMMPGIDGFEVCRTVKADAATSDIKVIMVTAKTSGMDIETGLSAGADHYITKPFRMAELSSTINVLLDDA